MKKDAMIGNWHLSYSYNIGEKLGQPASWQSHHAAESSCGGCRGDAALWGAGLPAGLPTADEPAHPRESIPVPRDIIPSGAMAMTPLRAQASGSPTRRAILEGMGFSGLVCVPANIDERAVGANLRAAAAAGGVPIEEVPIKEVRG